MRIEVDDVSRPQVLALLEEHLRNMYELSPPEFVFAFDASKLRAPGVMFWTAWEDDTLLGCAALKELSPTRGEVKSMRTPARLRRRGVGRALLNHILQVSRERGYHELFLETGRHPAFDAAQTLYRSVGFRECGPFGNYTDNGNSVFMSLHLEGVRMDFAHRVIARVYEHIEPIDRGERYENPLDAKLAHANTGRVIGGGSQLNTLGGIEYAEIEIELANLDGALGVVVDVLENAGAPKGSELSDAADGRMLRQFGTQQCLAIFLDGATLPDEVYASLDFDAVVAELGAAGGDGSYRGLWQGPEETGLFFFGPDAEEMFARIEPVLRRLPIGQNGRVVLRHGKQELNPREVRMPKH